MSAADIGPTAAAARVKSVTARRTASRRRRHPAGGGYARGARTRRKIIETAIEMFGNLGFDRTSTRAIARRAAVSLPALQYYFGGKEGLSQACAEYITADLRERLAPASAHVRNALGAPQLSRRELLNLLHSVLEPFIEGMATERPESWVLFFTRAQSEHGAAFRVLFERLAGPVVALCAEIVARLLQLSPAHPEALIRAVSMIGQIVLVRRGRPILLRALGWPDFRGKRLQLLKEVMWRQIEGGLR